MLESGRNCTDDSAVEGWPACYRARPDPIARVASGSDLNGSTRVDEPMAEAVRDIRQCALMCIM